MVYEARVGIPGFGHSECTDRGYDDADEGRFSRPQDRFAPRRGRAARAKAPAGPLPFTPDGALTFSKLDANYKSGNATRDNIPSHLIVGTDIPPAVAELYQHMCPAGVYERHGDGLTVSPSNCIDCKATDVIGPRWTPREGTSGPRYRRM
jgi:ferredoxin-like protein FixX